MILMCRYQICVTITEAIIAKHTKDLSVRASVRVRSV
jgi:hypothetical protein